MLAQSECSIDINFSLFFFGSPAFHLACIQDVKEVLCPVKQSTSLGIPWSVSETLTWVVNSMCRGFDQRLFSLFHSSSSEPTACVLQSAPWYHQKSWLSLSRAFRVKVWSFLKDVMGLKSRVP